MNRRLLFIGLAIAGVSLLAVGIVVAAFVGVDGGGSDFEVVWESEAAASYQQSYHNVVVADTAGGPVVAVPAEGDGFAEGTCGLAGYSADGDRLWTTALASEACTPHGVGRTTATTIDGSPTLLVTSEEGEIIRLAAASGKIQFRAALTETAVSQPATGDVTGDERPEILVTDFGGTVHAIDTDGNTMWTRSLNGTISVGPSVRDITGDDTVEVAVATRDGDTGRLTALDADGDTIWRQETNGLPGGMTAAESRGRPVLLVGEGAGTVAAYDATDGERLWEAVLQDSSLQLGDASEGRILLGGDGKVWALDLGDGNVAWNQGIGGDDDIVTEPVLGPAGLTSADVAIAARDGTVGTVSVATGGVDSTGTQESGFEARLARADLAGDDQTELILLRADGTVVVLQAAD